MMASIVVWYMVVLAYCEHHGNLGFPNDLSLATQNKSDYSVAFNVNRNLLYKVLQVNAFVVPYVNSAGVWLLCTWKAYQDDHSTSQMLYNAFSGLYIMVWVNVFIVIIFSVSVLVYLSTTLINNQLSIFYSYLRRCKDPFTLNRILNQHTQVMIKVNQANKFIKFVLGSINFLAVPVVSLAISMLSVPYDGLLMKCFVLTTLASFLLLLLSTAAFMASIHNKVTSIPPLLIKLLILS